MTVRNLDALFAPRRLLVLGGGAAPAAQQWLRNAEASLPRARRVLVGASRADWTSIDERDDWSGADAAVLLDAQYARPGLIARLAAAGCRALTVVPGVSDLRGLLAEGRAQGLRVLGARSAGVASKAQGLNLTALPAAPLSGSTALIAQSQSVAAAALDWALGRRIGFSWIATTGAEADVDVGDLLDYAALDPASHAVVLQLGRLRSRRKFMSAARACARGKPVVVLQTRPASAVHPAGPDPVRSAAFSRAGLVECESLAGLFDALAALEHLPPLHANRALVAGNGAGVCALGVDALLRNGLALAELDADTRREVAGLLPYVRFPPGAVDLGAADEVQSIAVLQRLLQSSAADALILVRGPAAGHEHREIAAALAAAGPGNRLLTVWLGLETAFPARKLSAEAKIATFTSADAAARALRYRWQHHRTQELLTQTPSIEGLSSSERETQAAALRRHVEEGRTELCGDDAHVLLRSYGLASFDAEGEIAPLRVRAGLHPELGLSLEIQPQAAGLRTTQAYAQPPLDDVLARRALEQVGYAADEALSAGLVDGLVRLADLLVEQAQISAAELRLGVSQARGVWVLPDVRLRLAPEAPPARERLALAPYPRELSHSALMRNGERYLFRAVRPSDERALLELLEQVRPEDIRLRFFGYIRHFTHAMAARMTQIDYDRELALVTIPEQRPGELVAIATLISDPDGREAEFAVLVYHGVGRSGVGYHLMDCLLQHARRRGIARVYGDVLRENAGMRGLARSLGFREHAHPHDASCVEVDIDPASRK